MQLAPCNPLFFAALLLTVPARVFADTSSYATVIQNDSAMQSALTQQMINLHGTSSNYSGAGTAPASCMPPIDLQRGVNGQVPPQLQGDPRCQQYLRCRQGQSGPQSAASAGSAPAFPATQHLRISATDFVPVQYGHPSVDRSIVGLQIAPDERQKLFNAISFTFKRVAQDHRRNNLSVSMAVVYSTALSMLNGPQMSVEQTREFVYRVNAALVRGPQFARMSPIDRQNSSDTWIFESGLITMLRDMGQRDPQARRQAMELSRMVLQRFTAPNST
jgi:hypothetical protein